MRYTRDYRIVLFLLLLLLLLSKWENNALSVSSDRWKPRNVACTTSLQREGGTEQRDKNIINNSAECAGMHTNSIRIQLDGFGTTHQFQYFVFLLDCVRVRCDVQWHITFGMHVDFVLTIKLWKLWWNSIPFARFFVFGACEQRIHIPFATKCWSFE